ncbi:MAG: NRDE family protein [Halieaceae bacterium]|nr:NRDE family protein [Halieaceae bacterium]
MCLIVLAHRQHPRYPLLVAANRDEFYRRPTAAAELWAEYPNLLAGRDLVAGGTWLGITCEGRFAAITNHRRADAVTEMPHSRGLLTLNFLRGETSAANYLADLQGHGAGYAGFHLLLGEAGDMYYYSNVEGPVQVLPPGVYGLSNASLGSAWPKVKRGKEAIQAIIDSGDEPSLNRLSASVANRRPARDHELPNKGTDLEFERSLSPQFIVTPEYGTRATTSLRVAASGEVQFRESNFLAGGVAAFSRDFVLNPGGREKSRSDPCPTEKSAAAGAQTANYPDSSPAP